VEFGRRSVDTIFAGQFGCRRPQLVGYRALSLSVLSPSLEAGTYLVYCERLVFAAHCHSSSRYNRPKNDVTSYAGQISCSLAESSLLIQASKFHKSRLLPLPDDVAGEVDKHLRARRAAYPSALVTEPLLWSPYGGDRAYTGTRLQSNLRILFDRAGIKKTDGRRPRVHDFRHGFAVNALIRWYRAGVDVQVKLPLLATWLGHVSILSTYHYLHFVEDLRLAADSRFIASYGSLVVPAAKNGVSL
jgi:hypothetical protein